VIGALICLAQMVGLPVATWERLLIWLAIGLVVLSRVLPQAIFCRRAGSI
jgi:hypothetical protein